MAQKGEAAQPFIALNIAVLTVSDSRSLEEDTSGATLAEKLQKAGHRLAGRALCRDDFETIKAQVAAWIKRAEVDVVITTGGTGLTGRDVTPEAITPLFEKKIDGFSALFHAVSSRKIGPSTIQSRATAGVANSTYIFVLPGSPGACRDAWDKILSHQLDARTRPCNLVEILPRLSEHTKPK